MLTQITDFIGKILYTTYLFVGDYGVAIILFTIAIRFLMLPLTLNQARNSLRTQQLQPELKALQKKYENDKQKLNEEMVKFFKEKNHNPANGCIGIIIQIPIFILVYNVLRSPISHMLNGRAYLDTIVNQTQEASKVKFNATNIETDVIDHYSPELAATLLEKGVPMDLSERILNFQEGMRFLGLFDLSKIPTMDFAVLKEAPGIYLPLLILIALLAIVSFVSSKMIMGKVSRTEDTNKSRETQVADQMQKSMLYLSPLMITFFSFVVPAGLTLYWLVGSVFQICQQYYIQITQKKEEDKKDALLTTQNKELSSNIDSENVQDSKPSRQTGLNKNEKKHHNNQKKNYEKKNHQKKNK